MIGKIRDYTEDEYGNEEKTTQKDKKQDRSKSIWNDGDISDSGDRGSCIFDQKIFSIKGTYGSGSVFPYRRGE